MKGWRPLPSYRIILLYGKILNTSIRYHAGYPVLRVGNVCRNPSTFGRHLRPLPWQQVTVGLDQRRRKHLELVAQFICRKPALIRHLQTLFYASFHFGHNFRP